MNLVKNPIKTEEDIHFFSSDRYWGKSPKEELEKALQVLDTSGWQEFRKIYDKKFDFTFEENRADWRFVMPITKDFTVLDAGAGMGRISIPLARAVKKVVSLDQSFLRMKFLKRRAQEESLDNIEVYVSDLFDAPFEDESFDLIVMNGLLEWVGATDRFSNPREAQIESLKVAKRLLKRGGYLYIGIENRLALANLRAKDHSGLLFTSYFPRWLANIYMKIRQGRKYDTYTYTKLGYEKLISEAGFDKENIEFYLPYPGYNNPRIMIPYKNTQALAYAVDSLMSTKGMIRKTVRLLSKIPGILRIYSFLFFSFGIVVKK